MLSDYLSDVHAALLIATGRSGGIAGYLAEGRVPMLGEDSAPWDVRGWLLPHVMDLLPAETGVGRGRWRYWLQAFALGRLPPGPIPRVDFATGEDCSRTAGGKMLMRCVDIIDAQEGSWRGECVTHLVEWIAWALHVSDSPSRLSAKTQEALYRRGGFCLTPLLDEPGDYFGWLLSEHKGRGTDPNGFYPTPSSVVELMTQITFEGQGDCRSREVHDPCVGTGRMLLHASNYSLRLSGQDIDRRCVLCSLINGALFAPWMALPLPEAFFAVAEEQPEPIFLPSGQGLLFPLLTEGVEKCQYDGRHSDPPLIRTP